MVNGNKIICHRPRKQNIKKKMKIIKRTRGQQYIVSPGDIFLCIMQV